MTQRNGNVPLMVLAGVVFVVSVVAVLILELNGRSTATLTNLVGPVVSGLFIVGLLGGKIEETKAKVDVVEKQTNGVLEEKFARHAEHAATSALTKAGVTPPPPPTK